MELQQIKTKTNWQEAVDAMNANSQAIQIEFEKVGEKNRGYYVSLENLKVAHPTGNIGDIAYVGTTAPFTIYTWNGSSWVDTGETGGSESIDLSGFLPNTGGKIVGDLEVTGNTKLSSFSVKGKTSADVLLGDGSTIKKDSFGEVKPNGTYLKMSVGFAEEIVGDGSATEEEFSFRPTAGGAVANIGSARIDVIKGNSMVWNKMGGLQYGSISASANNPSVFNQSVVTRLFAGHKYLIITDIEDGDRIDVYARINGANTVLVQIRNKVTFITSQYDMVAQSAPNLRPDGAIWLYYGFGQNAATQFDIHDLTAMYGVGNEPTTIEEFNATKPIGVAEGFTEGTLINGNYTGIRTTSNNNEVFIRDLGWLTTYFDEGMRSAGSARDEIRFNPTTQKWEAVQNVGVRAYASGDESNSAVTSDGTTTNYALTTPVITTINEDVNLIYKVWNDGSEEIIPNGASTPIVADIVYGINVYKQTKENTKNIEGWIKVSLALQDIPSTNLFDLNDTDVLNGYYVNGDAVVESSGYITSGYIPVQPSTTYYQAADSQNWMRFVNFYDANRNLLSTLQKIDEFETPSNCHYVRIVVSSTAPRDAYISTLKLNFTPYRVNVGTNGGQVPNIEQTGNVLWRKKWCIVGDSFSHDFSAGRPADWYLPNGQSKVYGRIIASKNEMELQWMAAGGRTMATPASGDFTNAFSLDLYKQIDADVDYITIYLGINDSHHAPSSSGSDGEDTTGEIPIGTIDDTTNATFYGAWNVVLPYLIEHHPFAHIGIIVSNGCETPAYREAEIAIARKYGIPFIDLNGDDRTPFMIRSQNTNIPADIRELRTISQSIDYDGSVTGSVNKHPNKDAHEYEAVFIENFLRTL